MHSLSGRHVASILWQKTGAIFSRILGISNFLGAHQDLLPGFYQVFNLIYFGMSKFQREKLTNNLPEKKEKTDELLL